MGNMKKNVFYLFTLSVVLWSCSHDQIEFPIDYDVQFSVELAKVWFEAYGESEVTIRSSTCCPDVDIEELKPMFDWDLADLQENADWSVVELPWEFENGYVSVSASDVKEYTENNEQDDATQLIRLVVMKNKSTGNIYGFKMMIIPDSNYVLNNSEELETNTYLNRSAGLNGYVMFYSLTDEFVNGWKYVDGQVVNKIEEADPEYYLDPETNGPVKLRSSSWEYVTVRTCHYSQASIDGGETWTEPRLEGCNSQTYAVLVANSGPGFGGGYSLEFGGTDGGGNPSSGQLDGIAKMAQVIFRNSKMNEKNWEAIEKMLEKILDNCLGRGLYNGLKNVLDRKTLIIEFDTEKPSYFGFTPNKGDAGISLNTFTKSDVLFHEMFHAFQSYQETAESNAQYQLNREIETWYAQYLYAKNLPDYKAGQEYYEIINRTKLGQSIRGLEQYVDRKGNLVKDRANDELNLQLIKTEHFLHQIIDNDGKNPYSKYQFDESRFGIENFKTLKKISSNCK